MNSKTKKRILIVDDAKEIREVLKESLEYEDYEVSTAINGQEAFTYLIETKDNNYPDLILLDLMMPIMDGHAFMEAVGTQNNQKIKDIPIFVISAKGDVVFTGPKFPTLKIVKPLLLESLLELIEKHI